MSSFAAERVKKSLCRLRSRIVAIAVSLLLADVVAAQVCLLPVETKGLDQVTGFSIYPTSQGVFLSTPLVIRPLKASGELDPPIRGSAVNIEIKVATVCDTPEEGVFFIGKVDARVYRYTSDGGAEELLNEEERNRSQGLRVTSAGVFLLLSDRVYKIQRNQLKPIDVDNKTDLGSIEVFDTGTDILFSMLCPAPKRNRCLYRLQGNRLARIDKWAFGNVTGARANNRGVYVGGARGVYRLDENDSVEPVPGMPAETSVLDLYQMSGDIFVATIDRLFVLVPEGHLAPLKDGTVHSMHNLKSGLYLLAADGVFHLDRGRPGHLADTWELQRVEKDKVETVKKKGLGTRYGVFFQSSPKQTHLLTDDGHLVRLSSVGDITDMVDSAVGALLVTDRAVYRFAQPDRWKAVPSLELGNIIEMFSSSLVSQEVERLCPDLRPDSSDTLTGYDLRLMSVAAADGLVNEGRNLVIVAFVGTDLHIRIFDASGKKVVDKAENELVSEETLTALKKQLTPIPDQSGLSKEHKQKIIGDATSIAAHTPLMNPVAGPVFVRSTNGVFRGIDSPLDFRSTKDLWNYIRIFATEVSLFVLAVCVIWAIFVRYSLYRWIRYQILKRFKPSRVHNQIFISYRRQDVVGHARVLYYDLCKRFDGELIFFDLGEDKMEGGEVFPDKLRTAVEQCSVLLALIGSGWLNAENGDKNRRLDDPDDFVRQEIGLALARGKDVIPVLLGDVAMPKADSLPEPLKPLSWRDPMKLGVGEKDSVYKADVDRLSRRLAKIPNIPRPKKA